MKMFDENEMEKLYNNGVLAIKNIPNNRYQTALRCYQYEMEKYENEMKKYEKQMEIYQESLKEYEAKVEAEEKEYLKRVENWEKSEEQRKNYIEQSNEQAAKLYERSLKYYETMTEREEIEYPKRVAAWEKNEEYRKQLIEKSYQEAVAAYEKSKSEHEALGLPFKMQFPKKHIYRPLPKPVKTRYNKPIEPTKQKFNPHLKPVRKRISQRHKPVAPIKPVKPDKEQFTENSTFSSYWSIIRLVDELDTSFDYKTIDKLSKLKMSNLEEKEKALQLILRELYLNKRIAMECSREEREGDSPTLNGLYGEKLTVFELELCILSGYKGKILHNLEIEVGNRTVQIDVLFITQKGIFVIESKNYSGSISGAEYQDKWNLHTKWKDYRFYNPVSQNQGHINTLSRIIRNTKFFSLIAFSERCKLKYIDIHKQNVFVFNRDVMHDVIHDVFSNEPDILSVQDVEDITNMLLQYCADNQETNPNYKESRSYFSAKTKAERC